MTTCHYCDGKGFTDDGEFDRRRPCPVCTVDDEHERARARALAQVDIDVQDTFG